MSDDGPAGVSRFLSYVLRHRPDAIGLTMDRGGWVDVAELVERSAAGDQPLTVELIERVVTTNDKQRFALSGDRRRIRANQGHSIDVDLGLAEIAPPAILYHGTAARFLNAILDQGLLPGRRTYVHLSAEPSTAIGVGSRHGEPVVLVVDSGAMYEAGTTFHRSVNGVWLTADVPARFLSVTD